MASLGNENTLETCKTFGQHPWLHNINYEFPHRIYVINSTKWCQVEAILQFWWIKCDPYWVIISTSSSGIDYVLNEHENICQYSPKCNIIQANVILHIFCKFGEKKCNPCWIIPLMSSSGNICLPNKHEDACIDKYNPYVVPSEILPWRPILFYESNLNPDWDKV